MKTVMYIYFEWWPFLGRHNLEGFPNGLFPEENLKGRDCSLFRKLCTRSEPVGIIIFIIKHYLLLNKRSTCFKT